ncbi:MAG TPA: PASTA domain-containing protein [Mycobacteriales bacterium]|nr:PASTA domain-containing protein [Mycobacteriales bacterium]
MLDLPPDPHVHTAKCLDEDCQLLGIPVSAMAQPPPRRVSRRALLLGTGAGLVAATFAVAQRGGDSERDGDSEPPGATVVLSPVPHSSAGTAAGDISPAPTRAAAPASSGEPAEVPTVVGLDLQTAQDTLRGRGFRTTSVDATGAGRAQVVDSNWLVVRQSPAGGAPGRTFQRVVLYVKQRGE